MRFHGNVQFDSEEGLIAFIPLRLLLNVTILVVLSTTGVLASLGAESSKSLWIDAAKTTTGAADDMMVIGRLPDTLPLRGTPGNNVLNIHQKLWDLDVNDAWIQAGIDTRTTFKMATDINFKNLTRRVQQADGTFRHEPAVYLRELKQLRDAGYTRQGNLMVPPPQ